MSHYHQGDECLVQDEFMVSEAPRAAPVSRWAVAEEEEKKKKWKGQNKNRPPPLKFGREKRICPILVDVTEDVDTLPDCNFPNCSFQHDLKAYLEKKPQDVADKCHVFNTYGRCPRGVTCRFGTEHISVDGDKVRNKVKPELVEKYGSEKRETNHLDKALQIQLRKKLIDFDKVDRLVEEMFKLREEEQNKVQAKFREQYKGNAEAKDSEPSEEPSESSEPSEKKAKVDEDHETKAVESGSKSVLVEEGIVVNDAEKKKKVIDWSNKLYLAPLTTVGNLPFRRICKEYGADITCGEMAMGLPILQGHQPEWALLQRHCSEDLFGVQLCGNSPTQMTRAAQLIEDYVDCDFVDINLGCPIDLVFKKGMGSGLMGRKKPLEVMVKSMTQILNRPLTLKMRTGIYSERKTAKFLMSECKLWGVDMVTLHGRSREQRYTKLANWNYIKDCVQEVRPMPVYGNGDIMNFEDYNKQKEFSQVDGVMIARGALIKPWLFKEIKEQRHWDISARERLDMIKSYANYGLEHWGSDDKGIENTRRFLLEWLSFLHRYVPYGILLEPPQRISQRLPRFKGRNELETLLSSPKCSDWIKITEMFLGKGPEGFVFEPKHRAHAY